MGHDAIVVHGGQHGRFTEVAPQPLAYARVRGPLGEQRVAGVCAQQAPDREAALGGAGLRRAGIAQVGFVFDGRHVLAQVAFGQGAQRRHPFRVRELAQHHESLLAQDGYLIIKQ